MSVVEPKPTPPMKTSHQSPGLNPERFSRRLELLKAYVAEHGDAQVPSKYMTPDGFRLGSWVYNIQLRNRSQLNPSHLAALEALPGWTWKTAQYSRAHFDERFIMLKKYVQQHGDSRVPQRYCTSEGFRLGRWVEHLCYRGPSAFDPKHVKALESLPGWTWTKGIGRYWNKPRIPIDSAKLTELVEQGLSIPEMADHLDIEEHRIRSHINTKVQLREVWVQRRIERSGSDKDSPRPRVLDADRVTASDNEVFEGIRRAANQNPSPLTFPAYLRFAGSHPGSSWLTEGGIQRRFNSWSAVCQLAGLEVPDNSGLKGASRKWTPEELTTIWGEWCRQKIKAGVKPSQAKYQAERTDDMPSLSLLRLRINMKSVLAEVIEKEGTQLYGNKWTDQQLTEFYEDWCREMVRTGNMPTDDKYDAERTKSMPSLKVLQRIDTRGIRAKVLREEGAQLHSKDRWSAEQLEDLWRQWSR